MTTEAALIHAEADRYLSHYQKVEQNRHRAPYTSQLLTELQERIEDESDAGLLMLWFQYRDHMEKLLARGQEASQEDLETVIRSLEAKR